MPSPAIEDHLKAIWMIADQGETVTTGLLAERLEISAPSVTAMVKRLANMHLVEHEPYRGVVLTPAGEKVALEVIRHHRLIETFLHRVLGVPWDKVHDEAERWEHVISEDIEDRFDEMLGFPTHDPHGAPIPTREGDLPKTFTRRLSEIEVGETAVIQQVIGHSDELLRYLGERGLTPGVQVKVEALEPLEGPLTIVVDDTTRVIGRHVARNIVVDPEG